MENTIIVRYGEVFLKKGNRPRFLRMLKENLKRALKRSGGLDHLKVHSFHGRYEVNAGDEEMSAADLARAVEALACTFGIVSVSPAVRVECDYETIEECAHTLGCREIEERGVATFKVETARSFKGFPMKSPEINRQIGARIIGTHPLPVRMANPELTVGIEIHKHAAFVFTSSVPAPGGLPVGSSGRAVLLLSGGIDSPVAAWMMAKRGCTLTAVHFHSYPYTTKKSAQKVADLAERLARYTGPMRLISMKITGVQEYLREHVPNDKLVLFYRRTMIRLADRVAKELKAKALVTGESLGQVASQTIENIAVIENAATMPILRPLIGLDKHEVIKLARKIDTYELSIQPYDDCCSLFLPPHPDTRGNTDRIKALEATLEELPGLEEQAWEEREEMVPLP